MLKAFFLLAAVAIALGPVGAASPRNANLDVRAGIAAWQKSDYRGAVAIWRPLAERGDPDAQFNLAQAYRLGRGVPASAATARSFLEKAAAQGHLEARTTLGLILVRDGSQSEGLRFLKGAAQDGEPRAMLVYGTSLINGDGVTQDRLLGYAFVHRAVAKGLRPAKATLDSLDRLMSADDRRKALLLYGTREERKAAAKSIATPKTQKPAKTARTPATGSTAAAAPDGGWQIQLGAFARPGAAPELYAKLAPSLPGRRPSYLASGKVTRLVVGPFETKAAALAACNRLSASGQPCIALPPR